MEPENDPFFEKPGRRRRAARWGVVTNGRMARSVTYVSSQTKRPHTTINVLDRESETKAHEGAPAPYKSNYVYTAFSERAENKNRRAGLKPDDDRNPNRLMPTSTTPWSLDKHKRWELLEQAEKKSAEQQQQQRRRALTQSYSDTDDISDDEESDQAFSDREDDEILGLSGRVSILQVDRVESEGKYNSARLSELHTYVVDAFLKRDLTNEPVEVPSEKRPQSYPVKGRKGFTVRERRRVGKKVRRATHRNQHAEQIYDLARADSLLIVTNPMNAKDNYRLRQYKLHEAYCNCQACTYSLTSRVKKARVVRKELLDQL